MKKAIATIKTEKGSMTIYYNGAGEEMTAEDEEIAEEIGCCPETMSEARKSVYDMYSGYEWELDIFDEE